VAVLALVSLSRLLPGGREGCCEEDWPWLRRSRLSERLSLEFEFPGERLLSSEKRTLGPFLEFP
jgi:hypothetical protein